MILLTILLTNRVAINLTINLNEDRSTVVAFRRPFSYAPMYTGLEFLKWISTQSYNVNDICDEEVENYDAFSNSKALIIIGLSEYWTTSHTELSAGSGTDGHTTARGSP